MNIFIYFKEFVLFSYYVRHQFRQFYDENMTYLILHLNHTHTQM